LCQEEKIGIEQRYTPIYDIVDWIAHQDDRKSGASIVRDQSRGFIGEGVASMHHGPMLTISLYVATWKNTANAIRPQGMMWSLHQ